MKRIIGMRRASRILLLLLASAALAAGGSPAAADSDRPLRSKAKVQKSQPPPAPGETRVFTLDPSTHGNPEGIAYDPVTGAFFVGTLDGTIYRGTLDSPTVTEFIPSDGVFEAAGMKVLRGRLYVAGAATGAVRVYDIASRELVASFETGGGGLLNDLVVTKQGDVYVTDSFRPFLWHITAEQVEAGGGVPEAIPVWPEIEYVYDPFPFNLNGIVALKGGRELVVVQTNTGKLFRIVLDEGAPNGRVINEIALSEPLFGDGLLFDRGRLVVVEFAPPGLAFVKLDGKGESGEVVERRTDPALTDASTVARARNYYLVVDPDFVTSTPPFEVIGLPRNDDDDD
jgi:sugar lactone lactonase YvrE